MKLQMTLACGLLLSSDWALAQDQAQQNLRQQQQQEQNWHWHQMEQEAAQQEMPPPPRPTGEWIKTWGAIASGDNGEGGISVGQLSKVAAENEAINQCIRGGGVNCRPSFTYYNQCVAILSAVSNPIKDTIQSAGSIEVAEKMASPKCRSQNNGSACEVVYSACSEPIFKPY